jgi:monoamine oxidase
LQIDLQDWAQETLTSTNKDKVPLSHHPFYSEQALPKEWRRILFLAGTERSMSHGGYLEGALDSSQKVVNDLLMVINGKVDMI